MCNANVDLFRFFSAGSIYALVCNQCSFVMGCSCITGATYKSTSCVTSGPLRSNTFNKINKRLFARALVSLERNHTRSIAALNLGSVAATFQKCFFSQSWS